MPRFKTLIDWNNDGDFLDTNEDVSSNVQNDPGTNTTIGRDQYRDLTPPMAGKASVRLSNLDRKYSPDNGSSPLFGLLTPGKKAQIEQNYIVYAYSPYATDSFAYEGIGGLGSYVVKSGDMLSYDVMWQQTDSYASLDLSNGTTKLSGTGVTDQAGVSVALTTDFHSSAYQLWYNRRIPLSGLVGLTINQFLLSVHMPSSSGANVWGTFRWGTMVWGSQSARSAWFRNAAILDASGNVKFLIIDNPLTAPSMVISSVYDTSSISFSIGTYYLWSGYTDFITPRMELENQDVGLPMLGGLSRLIGVTISTQLYGTSTPITTDVAINAILDAVGWPNNSLPFGRNIETGLVSLNQWWLNQEDAFSALKALFWTEGPGCELFEDAQGRICFYNHNHKITNSAGNTSQSTISSTTTEPIFQRPFKYDSGQQNIINSANVTTKTRTQQNRSAVWNYGSILTLSPNQTFVVSFSTSDPCNNLSATISPGGYTVASGSVSSVTFNRTSGQFFTMTIVAGSSGASIAGPSSSFDTNGITVSANLWTVTATVNVVNTLDTSASQAIYGVIPFTDPIRSEISFLQAQDLVNAIVSIYQNPRKLVQLTVQGITPQRELQGLVRAIGDQITIVETAAGNALNAGFWIERIDHRISQSGMSFETSFGCEQVWANNYFIIGTSLLGTGVLGF